MAVMSRQREQTWTRLLRAGLVQGAAPEAAKPESPWYVKVLLAFSGWLAAVFLLGFIGVGFQFILKSTTASLATGGLMIAGAFVILRIPRNEFFEHLALAVSLAGQALIVFAIFEFWPRNEDIAWLLVALLQASLAIVMPSFVHRAFSSFVAACACYMALFSMRTPPYFLNGVFLFVAAWLWLNEFRYPRHMARIRAIGYGLVLALIPIEGSALFGPGSLGLQLVRSQQELWVQPWMAELLAGAVMFYVVWQLLRRVGLRLPHPVAITALLGTALLSVASMEAHGMTVGMVIMLLGFAGGNRVLLGLGIVSLIFYISSYYYLLDATLLSKAQTLLIVGLVLLAVRWLMLRIMPGDREALHG